MPSKTKHPETLVLHAGYRSDPTTKSVAVPLYCSASYEFDSAEQAERLFGREEVGAIYGRTGNVTVETFEARMAALEGGVAAMAVSSGQSASLFSILTLCRSGDNFVCSTEVYGGSYLLFDSVFRDMGIEARFVDPSDPENFRRQTDKKTRCYFGESLPNPKLTVFPIEDVAAIGREEGIPLIIDNTAAPIICRPIDFGAAIIVHSTTKFIGGHGTCIGGVIVDSGTFDWEKYAERFPTLTQPDTACGGRTWVDIARPFGNLAYIKRAKGVMLRDLGAAMSPFSAFQFLMGLETLPLRMREHCSNAQNVAVALSSHPKVSSVIYPTLMDAENQKSVEKYLSGVGGGFVGIELKGGKEAGFKFMNALQMIYRGSSFGDTRSLVIHPASTLNADQTEEQRVSSGVTQGYVRFSIGIEHVDDILADIEQALASI
ncbi:MAG: O-acetylhomoserine aminocarboxypropyltransferase/cysteine synthase family protein [Alphaproteobacteria bacterium]